MTTAVAPRGVPASTNEVFPASPTQKEKTKARGAKEASLQAEISCQCDRDRGILLSARVNHQVGTHNMGRTDVRTAAGGLQDVSRKCVESAMQKLSLRFCGIIRWCYQRHETKTCFLDKACHAFSKPEARSTNQSTQSTGRFLVKNVTRLLAASRQRSGQPSCRHGHTHRSKLGHQLYCRHPFHFKSSDRVVARLCRPKLLLI